MRKRPSPKSRSTSGNYKVKKSMEELKVGQLHSGSKSGPLVRSRKQAIAIGLSEQRKYNAGGYR